MPRKPKSEANPESFAEIVSVKDVAPTDLEKALQEIADLKAKLNLSEEKRTSAEQAALENAENQAMMPNVEEVATGKTAKVQRCKEYETVSYKDDGRPILKPVWHTIELPTYFYKIDIPPVGGEGLRINGLPFIHNAVYEFDIDTLRSVKDMVYKCWKHDTDIHGTDENAYRKPSNTVLRGGNRQGMH